MRGGQRLPWKILLTLFYSCYDDSWHTGMFTIITHCHLFFILNSLKSLFFCIEIFMSPVSPNDTGTSCGLWRDSTVSSKTLTLASNEKLAVPSFMESRDRNWSEVLRMESKSWTWGAKEAAFSGENTCVLSARLDSGAKRGWSCTKSKRVVS